MKSEKFVGIQNERILQRKPNLKVCGNHFKSGPRIYRSWTKGQAFRDGKGWYVEHKPGEAAGK